MNIEKAIEDLKGISSARLATYNKYTTDEVYKMIEDDLEALDMAISALEEKLNGGWILVKDRPPEEVGKYSVSDGKNVDVYSYVFGWKTNDIFPIVESENILAWQPLPEPYREVENE